MMNLPLRDLAPLELQNYRARRYLGDDQCYALGLMAAPDQEIIRELYVVLQELFAIVSDEAPEREQAVQAFITRNDPEELVSRIHHLGRESYEATPSPLLAKTLHDVRGGGLSALLSRMQLVSLGMMDTDALNALYFLTRDHLKIMRNALLGLDDAKRAEDLLPKIHGTDFIVQKWNGARIGGRDRQITMEVECPQPVAISECCVEFGALDRILYNLINNACRHTAGELLRLVLFPVPTAEGEDLRFVLLNPITSADAERLGGGDLRTLFQTGVSTTGSGYGLSVAADFVANAYGLSTPAAAVDGGYLGARLLVPDFAVWFHWPIVAEY